MSDSYSQLSVQAVFAVRSRRNLIDYTWRDELHSYTTGILRSIGAKPLAVGGWLDHIHVFFALPTNKTVAEIVRMVKANSSKWINEKNFISEKFQWQEGYGAFSYSKDQRDRVIHYIANQEEHHRHKSFREEYLILLQEFDIPYENKYLFQFFDGEEK